VDRTEVSAVVVGEQKCAVILPEQPVAASLADEHPVVAEQSGIHARAFGTMHDGATVG
jgi:hypothetical protein